MKKVLLGLLVVLPLIAAAVWVVGFSSWMTLQKVTVTISQTDAAAGPLSQEQVEATAQLPIGTPLIRVDTGAIEDRIETLPQVQSATVTRAWPTALEISVVRRTPVAAVAVSAGGFDIVDATDVVIVHSDDSMAGVPLIVATGAGAPAAVTVAAGLPDWLREKTESIEATTRNNVRLHLRNGAIVMWGSAEQDDFKAKVLNTLLEVKALFYDVSAPEVPSTSDTVPAVPPVFPTPTPVASASASSSVLTPESTSPESAAPSSP